MKYWLMVSSIHITDIQPGHIGRIWSYESLPRNEDLGSGDIVYLARGDGDVYAWGHIVRTEVYKDVNLEKEVMRVHVARPVIREGLLRAEQVRKEPSLEEIYAQPLPNFILLQDYQAKSFNHLLRSQGVDAPLDPSEPRALPDEQIIDTNQMVTSAELRNASANTSKPPRVFISYSWESEDHKRWVRYLGETLYHAGIEARLDQWFVKPGESFTAFMEQEVNNADFVIVVCTPVYAHKSNNRHGGVGYEQQIVSGQLMAGTARSKFIPILRNGENEIGPNSAIPTHFLGTAWIDFRDDAAFEKSLEDLIRVILSKPRFGPPPLGIPPSLRTSSSTMVSQPNISETYINKSGEGETDSTRIGLNKTVDSRVDLTDYRASNNKPRLGITALEQEEIRVDLLLLTTGQRYSAIVSIDMKVAEVKFSLIEQLALPRKFENGWAVEYIVENRTQGHRLRDALTLQENGVQEGDTLVFAIESVAG